MSGAGQDTMVSSEVEVAVDPDTAFAAFTEELDLWWVRGPINHFAGGRALAVRCEPGVGGRLLEVYEDDALELGRITAWEPGQRLAWRSSVDDVNIDVSFAPAGGGCLVRVEASVPAGGPHALGLRRRHRRALPAGQGRRGDDRHRTGQSLGPAVLRGRRPRGQPLDVRPGPPHDAYLGLRYVGPLGGQGWPNRTCAACWVSVYSRTAAILPSRTVKMPTLRLWYAAPPRAVAREVHSATT